jgi:hypothetical protein
MLSQMPARSLEEGSQEAVYVEEVMLLTHVQVYVLNFDVELSIVIVGAIVWWCQIGLSPPRTGLTRQVLTIN